MKTPISIIIVDDEAPARNRLRRLLDDGAELIRTVVLAEAATGHDLLACPELQHVDLVLLDMEMPGMNGIECAKAIKRMSVHAVVVFVTSHAEFALDAFGVSAVDYLLKPVRLQRLMDALEKVDNARSKAENLSVSDPQSDLYLTVNDLGRVLRVPLQEVLYLQAEQKCVNLRTREHTYVLTESLLELEQRFAQNLIRIHRACLVNRSKLAGFENHMDQGEGRWFAVFKDWPERLLVSRRQTQVVKDFRQGR